MDIGSYIYSGGPKWGGYYWDRKLNERIENPLYLESYGYKVYSQNDEDGIIHEIFNRIGTENKTFVEFGVDTGIESNCHALLLQGWKGLWIEGRKEAYNQILRRFAPAIRKKQLKVKNAYVTIDNIEAILKGFCKDDALDVLSIDVDGNDWHIWNAIECVMPRVVIIEYNGKFAPEINWKMAYNPDHIWDRTDRQGASLKALELLGRKKGYRLVGTNMCGINAFFVREDLCGDRFAEPATAENLYNPARMNLLRYANGHPGRNYVGNDLEGMEGVFEYYPDWNVLTGAGFFPIIVRDNRCRILMREKRGRLFLRNIGEDHDKIRIKYVCHAPEKEMMQGIDVSVEVDTFSHQNFTIRNKQGELDIGIHDLRLMGRIVPIDITLSRTWNVNGMIEGIAASSCGLLITDILYD